jgi:hypothetical protein
MTTERTHSCNICRCRVVDDGTRGNGNAGIGLLFMSGDDIEQKSCAQVENHICIKCLMALHEIAKVIKAIV